MLHRTTDHRALVDRFRWAVPDRFNIGSDVVDRHAAAGNRPALIFEDEAGRVTRLGFRDVALASNRFANVLVGLGLQRGDRVGILLSQGPETAIAHVAAYKAGLIAVPLFTLFGPEALEYRLGDSGARLLVTDEENAAKVEGIRDRLPGLAHIIRIDGGDRPFWNLLERASDRFATVDTAADDPALIIYTSGTTGPPKGALHAHRVLLGHLPGVELPHDFFPAPGDLFWTPADWAWIGGLLDVLLPSWHHGVPVLAHRARKFDPDAALAMMARHGVRNVFFPPTALKFLRQSGARPPAGLALRTIGSGGETLGAELLAWSRATLGVTPHEFYGQTECNLVVGNCASLFPVRPGAMGKPIPGHRVAIIDGQGRELPAGETGAIAVRRPDPVMFLGYWNNPAATAAKFVGDWLVTGDLGRADEDGYLHYVGRDDDVITSAGYRIGPGEIEDCLLGHPAVAMAAAIGVPDPLRTEAVMAWLVLKPGHPPSDALAREIQGWVRTRLAAHEYPRHVAFVDALPMTATGKIIRRELRARVAADGVPAAAV
ncbi:acetyl-CoA synthetase [Stella humosa]|uniref:Acetyl-CoA synthetase n=1 Tax=Stella humosa TaxID=94 RepID=A0A3N1KUZ8_9PROT|nr:acyl-CoA synthetase [Stella humosa]ROP83067.1 acetyl-CoA synthetase [Stella humosa]BBK30159.1 AMP-dependent synthetase [Stella humosa]